MPMDSHQDVLTVFTVDSTLLGIVFCFCWVHADVVGSSRARDGVARVDTFQCSPLHLCEQACDSNRASYIVRSVFFYGGLRIAIPLIRPPNSETSQPAPFVCTTLDELKYLLPTLHKLKNSCTWYGAEMGIKRREVTGMQMLLFVYSRFVQLLLWIWIQPAGTEKCVTNERHSMHTFRVTFKHAISVE
jgi:hypothetical protein